jgi:hypothetical protein
VKHSRSFRASISLSLVLFSTALYVFFTSPNSLAQTAAANSWTQVIPGGVFWPERWDFQLVSHRGQLLVVGGQNQTGYLNDIWLSGDGASWRSVKVDGNQWGQRKYFRAIANKSNVLVLGGIDPAQHNQVFVSEDLLNWRAFSPEGDFWGERMFFSSTVIGDGVTWFIGGGSTPLGSEANDILIATRNNPWRLEQPMGHFDRRGHHEAVVHKGKFYLMSGKREDAIEKVAYHDIWVRDLQQAR